MENKTFKLNDSIEKPNFSNYTELADFLIDLIPNSVVESKNDTLKLKTNVSNFIGIENNLKADIVSKLRNDSRFVSANIEKILIDKAYENIIKAELKEKIENIKYIELYFNKN